MPITFLGVLFALLSAASWGGGDFSGGIATRKFNPFQVLILSALTSLIVMLGLAVLWGDSFPALRNLSLAIMAGIAGALGLTWLYQGLANGPAALVSSVAGVIGATIPMVIGIFLQGFPSGSQILGFILALVGIWVVSRYSGNGETQSNGSLRLAILAGFGFGGFLALVAQFDGNDIFSPLVVAKFSSLVLGIIILLRQKIAIPKITSSPTALVSGVLDAGGNIFYLLATQTSRLDIAAILSSLYPAVTVLLSSLILKEKVSSKQWIGVCICITAIVLITL
jgi:drug/metabolite transporter (DMT)-like permease